MMSEEETETAPEKLALDAWHRAHGARMVPFAGYEMPIQYEGIVAEHDWTRGHAGLFDVSHMGRLRFDSDQAPAILDRLVTRRVSDLRTSFVRSLPSISIVPPWISYERLISAVTEVLPAPV